MGWLHFQGGQYRQVRTKNGGGTRHLSCQKKTSVEELLCVGKDLFFPKGISSKGPTDKFVFEIRDFSQSTIPPETTLCQIYEESKLRMVRLYLCSKQVDTEEGPSLVISSDTDSDFQPDESTKKKKRKACPFKRKPKPGTETCVHENEKLDGHESFSSDHEIHESQHEEQNEFLTSSPVTLAIYTSFEDPEIQFGEVCDDNCRDLLSTISWHSQNEEAILNDQPLAVASSAHPLAAMDEPASVKEVRKVKIRRVNVIQDMLDIFMDPKVLDVTLRFEFVSEKAFDDDGVSREAYTAFWEEFLEQCEGEEERVPRLRPDYSEKEWQAVGRLWAKGHVDHGIIPVRLSPVFVLACTQGIDSVDESLLMSSFVNYLSSAERACVEKALQGNMDEIDKEDLLDLFTRMGSHILPPEDNMQTAILTMAHKVLLQEPKFVIDCFSYIMTTLHCNLLTKESVLKLYESKQATNRKVAQILKPSKEFLNQHEQVVLNHLMRYVRSVDQRRLESFLRFCTGSNVMCKDKIEVTFNNLAGLSRRPVAHTCGAVLDVPCTYNSYPEFRMEFDNILSANCFAMDIL
ncbi:uncharacterized protein LOC143518217 [Brachyhypopomus gauderio]|uniref:uncharacterized protein LOC143518217 n=1 Tax=Brachyhypopomus gauderio TaxID=698409 RepID=UPI0040430BB8